MVTAGAVVEDGEGRVLLLNHVFRKGSGWGIPGGFLDAGEHPEEALRRELREETGLEIESPQLVFIRTHKRPQQIEIVYRCRARDPESAGKSNLEIKRLGWFPPDALPKELNSDQRGIIRRVLASNGASSPD